MTIFVCERQTLFNNKTTNAFHSLKSSPKKQSSFLKSENNCNKTKTGNNVCVKITVIGIFEGKLDKELPGSVKSD